MTKFKQCMLLMAAVTCCSSGGCSKELVACEPLKARSTPIALEEILAVGRSADGTIVVIDRSADDPDKERLFVSDGETLVRQAVTGSGEGRAVDGDRLSLLAGEADPALRVLTLRTADTLRMKLASGDDALNNKSLDFEAAAGEELEILDASAVESLGVRNLPGDVAVEYFARVAADRLVVTRPERDFEYEDIRVFFGRPDALSERELTKFERYRDGGSTRIGFELDGDQASVFFPNRLQADGPPLTEGVTFEVDGEAREIERVLPAEDPELGALRFRCFEG